MKQRRTRFEFIRVIVFDSRFDLRFDARRRGKILRRFVGLFDKIVNAPMNQWRFRVASEF